MKERAILIVTFLLSMGIFVLHTKALHSFYYWKYPWFPLLVHFVTGFTVGMLLFLILINYDRTMSSHHLGIAIIASVFFIALAWEVFEFLNGSTATPVQYLFETLKGIGMGVAGALASLGVTVRNMHTQI